MPSNSHTRRRWFVCDNDDCFYAGVLRFVDPVRLPGSGLYTIAAVMCECRDIELRRVEAPSEPLNEPVINAPFTMPDGSQITVQL